ncbi:uncharacterized protein LACBIDRAFT_309061 [Laccaria bicolor S238N-H82]|uniref:Predicted protein n=1 Tax=Laccaria bicolor (strain S238N-H82 / ATCC MYA-4686) TaxID=486041 RepID=B0CVG1_LACBS|nr:uncharacterized protein LACBIDRAFT_309061 [Laccaria bicolor S238N-H82]EDR13325.1 predicted protein [Laccaria bicolor S238N-H82]|eukprot:XP_001875823.1 predicted protein [Laccaria bicolor S238N-H82]
MQTSLPNLPFPDYGDAVLDASGIHSSAESGPRTYPSTDLESLTPWTSFPDDIHQAILAATPAHLLHAAPFPIDGHNGDSVVENELAIHIHAVAALLTVFCM